MIITIISALIKSFLLLCINYFTISNTDFFMLYILYYYKLLIGLFNYL